MKKIILVLILFITSFVLISCNSDEINAFKNEIDTLTKENSELKRQIEILNIENADLNNTSSYKFAQAADLEKTNQDGALKAFQELIDLYPSSKEAEEAKNRIVLIQSSIKERKEKEEAKRKEYEESIKPPLQLVKAWVSYNAIDNPEARVVVKNISEKTVDAYTLGIYCYDRYGNAVDHYLDDTNRYGGLAQHTVKPGHSIGSNYYWTLYGHENTAKIKVTLEKVHMTDDTTWTPVSGQEVSIEGVSSK